MKNSWRAVLKSGDKLTINAYIENLGKINMNTKILDVSPRKNRDYIVIYTPNASGQLIPLNLGMTVKLSKEEGSGIYEFSGVVLDKVNYEGIKTSYIISVPKLIEKKDRRSLKRLEINLEVQFKLDRANEKMKDGVTMDISGGGFSFITKYGLLKTGDEILVNVKFDNFELKLQRCKITRGPIDRGSGIFLYSAAFIDIKIHLQDKIVGFIFRKEIEMNKRS